MNRPPIRPEPRCHPSGGECRAGVQKLKGGLPPDWSGVLFQVKS
ncbi:MULTISPECIES: hypothetical protein [Paenibacillus]|nr:hypothetical protein [Paenibacillus caseinilyticus]MCZ8523959.1 hypothetical protein [Paenibacillus caseinilyticus]